MPNPTSINSIGKVLFLPVRVALHPFQLVAGAICGQFQRFIGYFVRIGVFSFGEWNRSWFKGKIITIYNQGLFGICSSSKFDRARLELAFSSLENIGGIRADTFSKDGRKLDTMLICFRDVKREIEKHGGQIVQSFPINTIETSKQGSSILTLCKENRSYPKEYVDLILPKKAGTEWNQFCNRSLDNLGLERIQIEKENSETVQGYVMKHWDRKNPTRPKSRELIVRCNSPTESYAMSKKDIMRFILAGYDVLAFDPPGTWQSEGIPSEGGYYLAGETMVEKAVHEYGYPFDQIWAGGFCLGGALAVHLKKKYHEKGIHLFLVNSFDKMKHTLHSQVFPASHIAHWGINSIKSNDPLITSLVEQDGFASVDKLQGLEGKFGTGIVINTDTDTTIDKHSHARLSTAADKVCKQVYSILFKPKDRNKNGHRHDVLSNRKIWDKTVTYLTSKDYPHVLDDRRWWGWFI